MPEHDQPALTWMSLIGGSAGHLIMYFTLALAVWTFFYVVFRGRLSRRRVGRSDPTSEQVRREVLHSVRSIGIFALVTAGITCAALAGGTRLYSDPGELGWGWFGGSIAVMVVLHDAYFYWTHRLMHHPMLYKRVHHTHHLSTSPTPWAAYAFSPAEALIQSGIGPLIVFTIPVHPAAFAIFMTWQISFNVLGHCGYEVLPRWLLRSPAGGLLNSVTHHGQHHEKFRSNFSLYFNLWDRLAGTNHPDYLRRLNQPTGKP